jgi:hypothetical protein
VDSANAGDESREQPNGCEGKGRCPSGGGKAPGRRRLAATATERSRKRGRCCACPRPRQLSTALGRCGVVRRRATSSSVKKDEKVLDRFRRHFSSTLRLTTGWPAADRHRDAAGRWRPRHLRSRLHRSKWLLTALAGHKKAGATLGYEHCQLRT